MVILASAGRSPAPIAKMAATTKKGQAMHYEDDPWEARWTRGFEDAGVEELRLRRGAPAQPRRRGEDWAGLAVSRPIATEAQAAKPMVDRPHAAHNRHRGGLFGHSHQAAASVSAIRSNLG